MESTETLSNSVASIPDSTTLLDTDDNITAKNAERDSREKISKFLGHSMRIHLSDGRALVGQFLCTDQARNVILGSAHEYLSYEEEEKRCEPRILGLAMVPGKHIVSMQVDMDPDE